MANNLENYESVAERIEKWWEHYIGIGRLETDKVFSDGTRYEFVCRLYREITDLVPFATGWAEEIRSSTNRHPMENAETSAIGRALHNAGISKFSEGIPRPSLEEMRSYESRLSVVPPIGTVTMTVSEQRDPWSFGAAIDNVANELTTPTAILDVPSCQHGPMAFKEGVNGKTGKPYKGFVCTQTNRDFQCPARWMDTK